MNKPALRTARAFMYVFLGLSAGFPFIYLKGAPESQAKYINPGFSATMWALGGAAYIFGAVIYALRVPEKYFPKTFDYVGQSHNIHHICVLAGCAIHFNESMKMFLSRKEMVCPIEFPPTV